MTQQNQRPLVMSHCVAVCRAFPVVNHGHRRASRQRVRRPPRRPRHRQPFPRLRPQLKLRPRRILHLPTKRQLTPILRRPLQQLLPVLRRSVQVPLARPPVLLQAQGRSPRVSSVILHCVADCLASPAARHGRPKDSHLQLLRARQQRLLRNPMRLRHLRLPRNQKQPRRILLPRRTQRRRSPAPLAMLRRLPRQPPVQPPSAPVQPVLLRPPRSLRTRRSRTIPRRTRQPPRQLRSPHDQDFRSRQVPRRRSPRQNRPPKRRTSRARSRLRSPQQSRQRNQPASLPRRRAPHRLRRRTRLQPSPRQRPPRRSPRAPRRRRRSRR